MTSQPSRRVATLEELTNSDDLDYYDPDAQTNDDPEYVLTDDEPLDAAEGDGLPESADDSHVFVNGPAALSDRKRQRSTNGDAEDALENGRVFVPAWAVRETGGGNPAILYSQLLYWHGLQPNGHSRLAHDPYGGLPAWRPGFAGIFEQTGLNKQEAKRALKWLEHLKLVKVDQGESWNGMTDGRSRQRLSIRLIKGALEECPSGVRSKGVLVRRADVMLTNTGNQAIVLANLLPWFEKNMQGKSKLRVFDHKGRRCRACSYQLQSEETGLTITQVKRAIDGLKKLGFIETTTRLFAGKRTLYVWLIRNALLAAFEALRQQITGQQAEEDDSHAR